VPESEVLADREHRYAPPPRLLYEALTSEVQRWLRLRPREVWPEVLEADAATRVVWSSLWPVSAGDRIEFHIRRDGEGSAVRFVWSSPSPPDDRGVGLVRHHLNEAFAHHLRSWVEGRNGNAS
jgi:hypothetical protein